MAKTNKEIEYYRVLRAKMMVKAFGFEVSKEFYNKAKNQMLNH